MVRRPSGPDRGTSSGNGGKGFGERAGAVKEVGGLSSSVVFGWTEAGAKRGKRGEKVRFGEDRIFVHFSDYFFKKVL
jgi:hypothetical protein